MFFDDGYAQYTDPKKVLNVYYQSPAIWEDIHKDSRPFMKRCVMSAYLVTGPLRNQTTRRNLFTFHLNSLVIFFSQLPATVSRAPYGAIEPRERREDGVAREVVAGARGGGRRLSS